VIATPRMARGSTLRIDPAWVAVGVAVAVVVLLSLHAITVKSFWYDEAMSLVFARMAPDQLAATLIGREANGTFYYLVLSAWRLLGEGEARVRALSVLCTAATIPLLYLVGRRHVGSTGSALGCVLFAINPFVIEYAQEARMYAMSMLLVTGATLAWSFATCTDRTRWWIAYAVLAIAAVYTHFFCGFVILGLGLIWLLGLVPRTRRGLVAHAVIGLGGLPLVVFIANSGARQVAWIGPINQVGIGHVLGAVGGGSLLLSVALYAAALVAIPGRDPARARRIAPMVAWWLTPLVAGIAISIVIPLLEARYFIVALPGFLLLAGAGFTRIGSAIAGARGVAPGAAVGLALVGVLSVGPLTAWYDSPRWDWRGAASWVARMAEPGDRVTYVPINAREPFRLYLDRATGATPTSEATLDDLRATSGRAWLVLYLIRNVRWDGVEATLPGYRVVESKFFQGVRVQLIEPTP
jgi:mannosyltransferase